jgi:hypothetical protein
MATENGDKILNTIKNNLDKILDMIDEDTTDDARLETVRDIINEAFYKTLDLVPSHLR